MRGEGVGKREREGRENKGKCEVRGEVREGRSEGKCRVGDKGGEMEGK